MRLLAHNSLLEGILNSYLYRKPSITIKDKQLMPYAAPRPCTYPGCNALASRGSRCERHPYEMRRTPEAKERNRLYNTARWRKQSKLFKINNPLCMECMRSGITTASQITDHVVPHKGNEALFWDQENWQALCHKHHNIKTASEDGGFGNK